MKLLKLLKDKKGDSTFLFLLFLLVTAVMFLHATSVISHNVMLRSHLSRMSEEIAFNIASAGMDMQAATEGFVVIDQAVADEIARSVLERENAVSVTYGISLDNGVVYVELFFNNLRKRGAAHTLNIQ